MLMEFLHCKHLGIMEKLELKQLTSFLKFSLHNMLDTKRHNIVGTMNSIYFCYSCNNSY